MARSAPEATEGADARAPLGVVVALSVALVLAGGLLVAGVLWEVVPPTDLPAPFPDHRQDAETLIFLVTFGVLVPAGVIASLRVTDRIARAGRSASLSARVALLSAALAVLVLGARMLSHSDRVDGSWLLVAGAGAWFGIAGWVLRGATVPATRPDAGVERRGRQLWLLVGALMVPLVLSFTDTRAIAIGYLLGGLAFVALAVVLRELVHDRAAPRWLGAGMDVALGALLLLAVPNVVIYVAGGDPVTHLEQDLTQFHQGFFLGPANQVMAGDALLVDVLSQYGVGSIYFLAGIFTVVPMGYGTLGLIEGLLSAVVLVAIFATIRIAGVGRTLAACTMAVGVVVAAYRLEYPLGALLQQGSFRFGVPAGVLLGAVAEARWPRCARPARALQLVTVAVAAVWALEAFGHTLLTVFAVIAVRAALLAPEARRRAVRTDGFQVLGACVLAHVLLASATLVVAGDLPRWGWYLRTLREFLFGSIGDWTFDFEAFSPGLAIGAVYVASACALTVVLARRRAAAVPQPELVVAIGGMTAYGVALLSYLVNRSAPHIVPSVSLPAIALAALWLALIDRPALGAPVAARRGAFAMAMALAALLVAVSWHPMGTRYEESALAHVVPGGPTLRSALDRIRAFPPLKPGAVEGEQLLDAHMPGEERSIVLTDADLAIEILLRSERASLAPFGDPWEDSFVPEPHLDRLARFVEDLDVGDRLLLDADGRTAFDVYREHPSLEPLAPGDPARPVPATLAPLQKWVLREIGIRFDLRAVASTAAGLEVVELVERDGP